MKKNGKVYLVGAGPGELGLLTINAKLALARADIVLYDYLVPSAFFVYCSETALLINVGKRKGQHQKKQVQINDLLIEYAAQGNIVVRLKGGDPFVFARGGEEAEWLAKHNIAFEVIPGITSPLSVPIYSGIPVTHRHLSRSFSVLTGTKLDGKHIDSTPIPISDTLVFLMGVTHLDLLIEKIINETPFNKSTPAAFIYRGTTAEQKIITGTLGNINQLKKDNTIQPPCILVIGQVVSLQKSLNWIKERPLFGKRIVLLRPLKKNRKLVEELSFLGLEVLVYPIIKIQPIRQQLKKVTPAIIKKHDTFIFTSSNTVCLFFQQLQLKKYDARLFANKSIIAIGPATANSLKQFGIIPDKTPTTFSQKGILRLIKYIKLGNVLIPGSQDILPDLPLSLKNRGENITVLPIYKTTHPKPRFSISLHEKDFVLFSSPSTVRHFMQEKLPMFDTIVPLCLGKSTQHVLKQFYSNSIILDSLESNHIAKVLLSPKYY